MHARVFSRGTTLTNIWETDIKLIKLRPSCCVCYASVWDNTIPKDGWVYIEAGLEEG